MVREVETSEPTGFLIKSITTNLLKKCRSGGMVYTNALGAFAIWCVGSSPTFGTKIYGVVAQ